MVKYISKTLIGIYENSNMLSCNYKRYNAVHTEKELSTYVAELKGFQEQTSYSFLNLEKYDYIHAAHCGNTVVL